ncbi:MAG: hypothetical protein GQ564_07420 [Bacteroidales bacterium]|nr:hypothetical protein [Bacteroidales bacterium]
MPKFIIYILIVLCVFKIQAQAKFKVSAEDLTNLLNIEVQKEKITKSFISLLIDYVYTSY